MALNKVRVQLLNRLIKTEVVLKFIKKYVQNLPLCCLIKTEVVLKYVETKLLGFGRRFNKNRSCIEMFDEGIDVDVSGV